MVGILRSCAARSAVRRLSVTETRRRFAAACAIWDDDNVDDWSDWEESSHVPLAEGTCGERGPRGVQWVFMGSPGVQKRLYAARMAQLLDVPYISMGTLVRQELNPRSSIHLKVAFLVESQSSLAFSSFGSTPVELWSLVELIAYS